MGIEIGDGEAFSLLPPGKERRIRRLAAGNDSGDVQQAC